MIKKEPRIRIADIFAVFFIVLGLGLFLVVLHILAINATGDTSSVLTTIFTISVKIFEYGSYLIGAGILIHIIRYLAWQALTPKWLKAKMKRERNAKW